MYTHKLTERVRKKLMYICVYVCFHRQATEALLRYHLYVDCMPVEGVEGMSEEELSRVIDRTSHTAKNDR